ncbi:MAG: hypothetical protein UW02_C0006G0012 [Candidatus Nomurabacteria bacterium GW2011_GWB1_43_7]|uniref:Fimbrial assembly family protein n=2 Tax=Candidatus Nomuraibacteriota TaxID=1752729 RepID=A0A0G1FBG4_9BACT|nr:MAG: hypothetical protein UW02_C0006G0012 [Candidatus Nomurabacteria bacterium GW2011_GWB1_43_7]
MINLIPNQEKKKKVKDFYFRLTVVLFMVLGCCVLVASVSILPSYFLSSINKNLANEKLEMQKKEPMPLVDQDSLTSVEDLNSKLSTIENAEKNKYLVSQKVINEIIFQKMPDIKISQIFYENNVLNGKKINIRGLAPSRERLLLFRRALEDDITFKKVDLPISNFVKGSNIEFYLSIIPS